MQISLPEQVALDYTPAGFGSRAIAYLADFFLRWSTITLIALIILYLLVLTSSLETAIVIVEKATSSSSTKNILIASIVVMIFLVEWCYPICFEVFNKGVTPGKFLIGLRVVDERGLPITIGASFIRTALTLIDLIPGTGLLALLFISLSKRRQRLGDLAARTLVVYDERFQQSEDTDIKDRKIGLPLAIYSLLRSFIERKSSLTVQAKKELTVKITDLLKDYTSNKNPHIQTQAEKEIFCEMIYKDSFPKPIQAQQVSENFEKTRWQTLKRRVSEAEAALNDYRTTSFSNQSYEKTSNVALKYQDLCQTLATFRSFYPSLHETRATTGAVQWGRRLLYSYTSQKAGVPFLERARSAYSQVKWHCLVSFTITLLTGWVAWCIVQVHPGMSWRFITEEMASGLSTGKLWTESIRGINSIASASIMTNNIGVAILAFGLGITGGIGTIALLIFNGASVGGLMAAVEKYGMLGRLLDFMVAHGVLEISIIIVAGGCGLFLGDGILHPGSKSRREALQHNARVGVDLLLFSALWLIPAGIVEGFVSPSEYIPFVVKLVVGITLGGLYWAVLIGRLKPQG